MPTTVVNIKREPFDIYIGRGRRGSPPSKWGNPFILGKVPPPAIMDQIRNHPEVQTFDTGQRLQRNDAIMLYRALVETKLEKRELTADDFRPLKDARLGCFCKPQACHGDVLAEITERLFQNVDAVTASG